MEEGVRLKRKVGDAMTVRAGEDEEGGGGGKFIQS